MDRAVTCDDCPASAIASNLFVPSGFEIEQLKKCEAVNAADTKS
jgi:hypothetical protein